MAALLERQTRELKQASDERAAIAEVLGIVVSSPNDAQLMFESIARTSIAALVERSEAHDISRIALHAIRATIRHLPPQA